ncbi:TAXI family TRAP transporter solute-binding subunit [Kibdelosporangium philippinense]|uniref:TAXI family TRAP transporter solute-binding subunit n=1 Tax=Kibdelosporangium philippinense TaxID=211113 RepID=A0ABS8ZPN2_9PSEU|nr:TAXI family TRAP transporter solute-binding subunit [Kibdelosporangium philippinense]MCE7009517.1 TAXI family TRAP transporter solute-binding subunit [Kibdelosporangium philippinense]
MSRKLVTLITALLVLAGCTSVTENLRLTIATGFPSGVYNKLGHSLASEWNKQTGMPTPTVLSTQGSIDNVKRLESGQADIAFSAADVAVDRRNDKFSALARIYDDYLHIVVRADSPIRTMADLNGKRIGVGAPNSGVINIANRVLDITKIDATRLEYGLPESTAALRSRAIDAFFWSGGLPTDEIVALGKDEDIRLLDMSEQMKTIRGVYRYYGAATIPLSTYRTKNTVPVTTLTVPNLLMVTDRLNADAAKALTQAIFAAQQELAAVSRAANSIDIRSAVETQPVPLHPGAREFYRDEKRI